MLNDEIEQKIKKILHKLSLEIELDRKGLKFEDVLPSKSYLVGNKDWLLFAKKMIINEFGDL